MALPTPPLPTPPLPTPSMPTPSMLPEPKLVASPRLAEDMIVRARDRRILPRSRRDGWAMAAFYDADGAVCLTRVHLVDSSPCGLGILCPIDVAIGTRFSLYSTVVPLPHTTGVVVWNAEEHDATAAPSPDDGEVEPRVYRLGLRRENAPQA